MHIRSASLEGKKSHQFQDESIGENAWAMVNEVDRII